MDLVEWQLRVAGGQTLPLSQDEILCQSRGCAVEARIYAENPLNDFLPSTGRLVHLQPLSARGAEEGVRVDAGITAGNEVSTYYDPMIAKLIAYGDNRAAALQKLERALRDFQVKQSYYSIISKSKFFYHFDFIRMYYAFYSNCHTYLFFLLFLAHNFTYYCFIRFLDCLIISIF